MAAPVLKGEDDCRLEKVERVFQHFDSDGDGGLDRLEMAALVVALNPRIKFTKEQIDDIVDQVFRLYSKAARVTLDALLCIYDDIAGDVYRDFDALGLGHLSRHTSASPEKGLEWERTSHDEEGGDVADLSFKLDRLPSMDCSVRGLVIVPLRSGVLRVRLQWICSAVRVRGDPLLPVAVSPFPCSSKGSRPCAGGNKKSRGRRLFTGGNQKAGNFLRPWLLAPEELTRIGPAKQRRPVTWKPTEEEDELCVDRSFSHPS